MEGGLLACFSAGWIDEFLARQFAIAVFVKGPEPFLGVGLLSETGPVFAERQRAVVVRVPTIESLRAIGRG
jgi:hypothetical protein